MRFLFYFGIMSMNEEAPGDFSGEAELHLMARVLTPVTLKSVL